MTARPMGRHVRGLSSFERKVRSVGVLSEWGLFVAIPGLFALAACAGGDDTRAEAACREKGYSLGTVEFAECLHPEDAEQLRRAQEAWERDAEDRRQ